MNINETEYISCSKTEQEPIDSSNMKDNVDNSPELYLLNKKNIYITELAITDILKKYDIECAINNLDIYQIAMTHISYLHPDSEIVKNNRKKFIYTKDLDLDPIDNVTQAIPLKTIPYERLEFLGDSVIRTILSEYLYFRYPQEAEGFMTKLRTKLENDESLARLSKIIGLNKYILISKLHETKNARELNISILEDVFEAFIGALFIENGYDICKKFMINIIEKHIDFAAIVYHDNNYKDQLLRLYHRKKWSDPKYSQLVQHGTENKKEYTMFVTDNNDNMIGMGTGPSRRKGEQAAAYQALIKLGILHNDTQSDSSSDTEEYNISESDDESYIYASTESDLTDNDSDVSNDSYRYIGTESD